MNIHDSDGKLQEEIYRFLSDLEFLQCLANPLYLECIHFTYLILIYKICLKMVTSKKLSF